MLVNLQMTEEQKNKYNALQEELKVEHPDLAEYFTPISSLDEIFLPYTQKERYIDWSQFREIQADYKKPEQLAGIYIAELNSNHTLERITNYKETRVTSDSPIYWYDYGVADNASQVLDYYEELCKEYGEYMDSHSFVILMVPFFVKYDPEWRWCKWGKYIGKHSPEYEYLGSETDIDYIFTFHIYEVEKQEVK